MERMSDDARREMARRAADGFDGGRTAAWAGAKDGWTARHGAHTLFVLTDRAVPMADIALALRLMEWMSGSGSGSRGQMSGSGGGLTAFWWDQPWDRWLPAHTEPGRDHVNGGWAIPGIPEVHVYRREEFHKVLLHESIHALSLDVPHEAVGPVRRELERQLGRRLWPHLGEAYTELFAEWLWAIAGARTLSAARTRWSHQLDCAQRQACQIWARIRTSRQDEDTNVFAYFVLKWVLMQHSAEVLVSADGCLGRWVDWWNAASAEIRSCAVAVAVTSGQRLPMGMTCGL